MRKRIIFFFLLVLFLSVQPGSAETTGQAQYVIKWGTIAPENTAWGSFTLKASQEMEKRSGGRLKNLWYFGAVMGDEPDMIRKARINQLQGLSLMTIGISRLTPELTALSLPFLFQNYEEVDCVFDRIWPTVEEIINRKGYVILGRADVGFSVFFSKRDLGQFGEVKKTNVWKWDGLDLPLEQLASWIFGMNRFVTLSLPDVLTALQTGMVDTVYATYYTAIALQWQTQFKYMTDVNVYGGAYAPALLLLKKETFASLPPDVQKIMREVCDQVLPQLRQGIRNDEAAARLSLLKRGVKFLELNPVVYKLGRGCMESSIFDYYRRPETDDNFLRKSVRQCLDNLYQAAGKELDLSLPSDESTEKLVRVFKDMEERFFSRKLVGQILEARDQCVQEKKASPK